ncbi:MAG: hypothetical protein ACR2PM_18270 [Hyphomicrobiales bacterium]
MKQSFLERGWCRFPFDPALADWVGRALPAARGAVEAPENANWLRCGDTWFAGVNVLDNDETGAVKGGSAIAGDAVGFIRDSLGITGFAWDRAQVSVCYPGYPQPMASEPETAYRYRRRRDAAHVDGLLPVGPDRRRHLREHHGFVLGIPMVDASPDAAPFVIWEGSHEIVRRTFMALFQGLAPESWGDLDVTEAYHALRREIFDCCTRVELAARPGEAYLVHRLALHGVAPWGKAATAGPDGRMIVYFRPEFGGPSDWLSSA